MEIPILTLRRIEFAPQAEKDLGKLSEDMARTLTFLLIADLAEDSLPIEITPYSPNEDNPFFAELEGAYQYNYEIECFTFLVVFVFLLDERIARPYIRVMKIMTYRNDTGGTFMRNLLDRLQDYF